MAREPREDMTRSPQELGKERCAVALRKALAASGRFATIRELANATGINYSTLKGYFQGRKPPGEANWRRLAATLGQQAPTERAAASERKAAKLPPEEALKHAAEVKQEIQRLSRLLDFFKHGSSTDREALRRIIPGRDVGYLTSLIRALYDEDQFETWILFSEYTMEEDDR